MTFLAKKKKNCAPEGGQPFSGICPLTGITSVAGAAPITHLGVLHGRDPAANAEAAYTALIARMQRRAQRYMRIDLGFYGRAYIAKQVLASMASHFLFFIFFARKVFFFFFFCKEGHVLQVTALGRIARHAKPR